MGTFTKAGKCKYNRYIFVVKTGNKDLYDLFCEVCKLTIKKNIFYTK